MIACLFFLNVLAADTDPYSRGEACYALADLTTSSSRGDISRVHSDLLLPESIQPRRQRRLSRSCPRLRPRHLSRYRCHCRHPVKSEPCQLGSYPEDWHNHHESVHTLVTPLTPPARCFCGITPPTLLPMPSTLSRRPLPVPVTVSPAPPFAQMTSSQHDRPK